MKQESLAQRLRIFRAQRGLSVKEASALIGVEWHTLRDLELGRRKPYYPTLNKVAEGYGVPVEELLELEGGARDEPAVPLAGTPGELGGTTPPCSFAELMEREGGPPRLLTLSGEEFGNWWLDVDREEVIRRFWRIEEEYRILVEEWRRIIEGTPTVAPELQAEIRRRIPEFFGRRLLAAAAAPGQGETEEEFHERQSRGDYRQLKEEGREELEQSPEKTVARV